MVHRMLSVKALQRWGFRSLLLVSTLILTLWVVPASAQQHIAGANSVMPVMLQIPGLSNNASSSSNTKLGGIELDGQEVFQIAAPRSTLSQRQQRIENNLDAILDSYLQQDNPDANVVVTQTDSTNLPSIYVNDSYLMTITEQDAEMQGTVPWALSQELEQTLRQTLRRAWMHRQPGYLRQQAIAAGIAVLIAIALVWALEHWRDVPIRWGMRLLARDSRLSNLDDEQRHHLRDAQMRLLPIIQGLLLVGVLIWIAGLFPQTRSLQNTLIPALKAPLIIAIIIMVAYVGIRLSYATINRFVGGLTARTIYDNPDFRRLQLRTSTISSVIKNVATFVWIGVGIFVALTVVGVDFGLLLASFGVLGLALSLAAQNLIKGATKGFFIILEDQYAIGDVVKIDDDAGLVETMNLRITQLRDTAGRLITIPMSDVTRVANYSLHWSRADLKIPVHYNADIDQMLDLTRQVGQDLQNDPNWQGLILEEPQVLGVDEFGDSSVMIRIWIKTQPLKQWDVSREYRRRFKLALKDTDTTIPFPQREVWLHPSDSLKIYMEGRLDPISKRDGDDRSTKSRENNPRRNAGRTDRQPPNVPDNDDTAAEADESDVE
ncbi:MAG TPA: mechanosensitive ion channel family protein [Elainellaceae cyanobacterium]